MELLKPYTAKFKKCPFELAKGKSGWKLQRQLKIAFKIGSARLSEAKEYVRKQVSFKRGVISIEGYDLHLADVSILGHNPHYTYTVRSQGFKLTASISAIIISFDNRKNEFSLEPLKSYMATDFPNDDVISFELVSGEKRILVVPKKLKLQQIEDEIMVTGTASIFLRKKDWE